MGGWSTGLCARSCVCHDHRGKQRVLFRGRYVIRHSEVLSRGVAVGSWALRDDVRGCVVLRSQNVRLEDGSGN
jgi:hypothetical protein